MKSLKNLILYIQTAFAIKKMRKSLSSNNQKSTKKEQEILFCPFNSNILNMSRESIMATGCELKGAKVQFLQYDLTTDGNDFLPGAPKSKLKIYYRIGRLFYKVVGMRVIKFSSYSQTGNLDKLKEQIKKIPTNELEEFEYKGVKVGNYAVASAIRLELAPYPLWENNNYVASVRSFLLSACIITDAFNNLLDENNFDKIVMSHGIYVSWGVIFSVARQRDINVDVYNGSYRKNTIRFYKNVPNAPFPIAEWPRFKDVDLTEEENSIIEEYTGTREDQSADGIQLFDGETDYPDLNEFIGKAKKEGAKIACLFTNISWDAYSFSSDAAFGTMSEWLAYTLDWMRQKNGDNLYLIIKAHPAEIFHKVPDKYRIKMEIPSQLPDNVYFISETMNVKPFSLYKQIDFGIIHISTVAIEMALMNIPVLTSGANGHYSNKGFTIDPKNKEEYGEMLSRLSKGELEFNPDITIAKRYMYYRFFREAIPFSFVQMKNGVLTTNVETALNDKTNIEGLKCIVEGIMDDKPFVYDWSN